MRVVEVPADIGTSKKNLRIPSGFSITPGSISSQGDCPVTRFDIKKIRNLKDIAHHGI
jgi:hypothetical protein